MNKLLMYRTGYHRNEPGRKQKTGYTKCTDCRCLNMQFYLPLFSQDVMVSIMSYHYLKQYDNKLTYMYNDYRLWVNSAYLTLLCTKAYSYHFNQEEKEK